MPNRIVELNGKEAIIEVSRGKGEIIRFKIDSADIPKVRAYRWFSHMGYCCTQTYGKQWPLTWLLFGKPPKRQVLLHRNGDKSDNRKSNIRLISRSASNLLKRAQANLTTGRRGISIYTNGPIVTLIGPRGERKSFKTIEEAIEARESYERAMLKTLYDVPDNKVTSNQ